MEQLLGKFWQGVIVQVQYSLIFSLYMELKIYKPVSVMFSDTFALHINTFFHVSLGMAFFYRVLLILYLFY